MSDEDKYKNYNELEKLVGDRIEALDDKYTDSQYRNKESLEKVKEKAKERLKFRTDFLATVGGSEEKLSDDFIYDYQNKGLDGRQAGKAYLDG